VRVHRSEIGKDKFDDLRKRHCNTALTSIMRKDNLIDGIKHGSRSIHVKVDPVYQNPESHIGRAHFYAPFKYIGNQRIATINFNALIIILMTIMLYIALYYNWLGSLLKSWQVIKRKLARQSL